MRKKATLICMALITVLSVGVATYCVAERATSDQATPIGSN